MDIRLSREHARLTPDHSWEGEGGGEGGLSFLVECLGSNPLQVFIEQMTLLIIKIPGPIKRVLLVLLIFMVLGST